MTQLGITTWDSCSGTTIGGANQWPRDNLYTSPGLFTELRFRGFQAAEPSALTAVALPLSQRSAFP